MSKLDRRAFMAGIVSIAAVPKAPMPFVAKTITWPAGIMWANGALQSTLLTADTTLYVYWLDEDSAVATDIDGRVVPSGACVQRAQLSDWARHA